MYLVPAFVGLGAPHWDPYARGTVVGMTRGTTASHLARAAVDSMAYQTRDVLEAMQRESACPLQSLRVDGGAAANNQLLQFQADILGVVVRRPVVAETTALGAAYLAGLAVGYWETTAELEADWALDREFAPAIITASASGCTRIGGVRSIGRADGRARASDPPRCAAGLSSLVSGDLE